MLPLTLFYIPQSILKTEKNIAGAKMIGALKDQKKSIIIIIIFKKADTENFIHKVILKWMF